LGEDDTTVGAGAGTGGRVVVPGDACGCGQV